MATGKLDQIDNATLDRYRKRLTEIGRRLRGVTLSVDEQARSPVGGHASGELSNAPMHLADAGSEEFAQDLNNVLLENEEYLLTEVTAALDRVALGTFGHCEQCGKLIAATRLDALPHTRYCIQCANELGAGLNVNLNAGRPRTGEALAPERAESPADQISTPPGTKRINDADSYAEGTPGGGSAVGGLAGTNEGHGEPNLPELEEAGGSSNCDADEDREDEDTPQGGPSGGAVGGTPAGKRTSGR